jgi:hypothetical protein
MYEKIKDGTIINIQGLDCCIPPAGYVVDMKTKELRHVGIYSRSENIEEQYWERIKEPDWYWTVLKQEDAFNKKRVDDNAKFFDERYEEYKQQEWDRRLHGFWFMNNGNPVYLVGAHYLFLQHIKIDVGSPKFRTPDLDYFYFLQYVIEDPNCMGMLEVTKRRFGKTFRGGVFVLDYPTRTKMTNGTIQSKTGADAKKVFAKAVVDPFKKLPRFFKPEYDLSGGVTPKSELRFQNTNVRGKKAEENLEKEELGSLIDFYSADALATDGQKIHRKFDDEWAKTTECNIYDRHDVTRYCLMDDEGRIIGKVLYSSTVEVLETEKDGVQEAAINLWNDSDQLKKGKDGRTASGLYRFFMTASRAKNFNIYGEPDVEKTIKEILADRETVKHNQRSLAARIRKEPLTIREAFYAGNDKCEFNAENINNQIQKLEDEPVFLRQVRLVFKKEKVPKKFPTQKDREIKKVGYMDDQKGGWFLFEEPLKPNSFEDSGGYLSPTNKIQYQIGVDTTQNRIAIDGSNPSIVVFKKSLIIEGEEKGMYPVAMWVSQTRLDIDFDEEVLKACMWYGCTANYEIDRRTDYYRYFCKELAQAFLEWTPKIAMNPLKRNFKPEYGTRSGDPFQLAQQLQCAKMYIDGLDNEVYNGHVHRIVFPTLLKELLMYNHLDRTKSDQVVGLMMALLPVLGEMQSPKKENEKAVKILPTYKINMAV